MRSVRFVLAALVAGLALAGCKRQADSAPGVAPPDFDKTLDPERRRFPQHRFSARFPKGFTPAQPDNPKTVVLVVNAARSANINIRVPGARRSDSLDDIVAEIRDNLASGVENPQLGVQGEFDVGGRRCAWLTLAHGPPSKRLEVVAYLIKRETDLIMVFGTANTGELTHHRAAFDDCVRSIEFE